MAEQIEAKLAQGEEIDIAKHALLTSTAVRVASRIGIARHVKDITTLSDLIRADQEAQRQQLAEDAQP